MRYTDIAIISGGLSGSTAAAMLGRAGISTVLIDPHEIYPADFRVEKLSGQVQVERFLKIDAAPRDICRRELDRAIRPPARQGTESAVQHRL